MKAMKRFIGSLFFVLVFVVSNVCAGERQVILKTAEDAERIAETITFIYYGKERSEIQRPYSATANGDLWDVVGTLHTDKGGVVNITINKYNCNVVNMTHGK